MLAEPRDRATRRSHALARLTTPAIDVWVATATPQGAPHLVPLSLAWAGERVVVAVAESSLTARNLIRSGSARLAVGPTRDVVMIDATLERAVAVDADEALAGDFATQADWDPRGHGGYVFLVLRPDRIQAWRESNELSGRTLMLNGCWLGEQ